MAFTLADPLMNEVDASTLESVRKNVVYNNLFVNTPFQAKLRQAGVFDPFLGGSGMQEGIIFGRPQGSAVRPGQTITITRQQMNTAMIFQPKAYAAWLPIDDWELDDGSGTGGVINSGPAAICDLYSIFMQLLVEMINTMIEMDSFRHGQAAGTGITDNRILDSNGLSEALNNGVDPSWDGNVFTTYGGNTRNGVIGPALNSTPLWCGNSSGGVGQIDTNVLMRLWSQCAITGGNPTLAITNVFGFVAVVNALEAQRRDVSLTQHNVEWKALSFNGMEIYQDPLAPSALSQDFLALTPAGVSGGKAGNNNLIDGAGSNTITSTFKTPIYTNNGVTVATGQPSPTGSNLPCNTTVTVGEVISVLDPKTFKIRPTNKSGWNYGVRSAPMPNNVSLDAMFMRLGTNLYNTQPRQNCHAYGFGS